MSQFAISIQNIGKEYRIPNPSGKGKIHFSALKDISINIPRGEIFGLIGPNGAGKSTLLKILARITPPSAGRIEINGRMSSLLEVGTGFHHELTGRENIFLNGAILGMQRHEIKRRFDEIVEFSGVKDFLNTPVKHYSSGMYVRLAFSVAAHLDSEILLIDEVLAVGDAEFQRKCIAKMEDASSKQNRTVLFVSHNMNIARSLCNTIAFLEDGALRKTGPADKVADFYLERIQHLSGSVPISERKDRQGSGEVMLAGIGITNTNKGNQVINSGDCIEIRLEYRSAKPVENLEAELHIFSSEGVYLTSLSHILTGIRLKKPQKEGELKCVLKKFPLMPGNYYINALLIANGSKSDHIKRCIDFTVFSGDFYDTGTFPEASRAGIFLDQEWYSE